MPLIIMNTTTARLMSLNGCLYKIKSDLWLRTDRLVSDPTMPSSDPFLNYDFPALLYRAIRIISRKQVRSRQRYRDMPYPLAGYRQG